MDEDFRDFWMIMGGIIAGGVLVVFVLVAVGNQIQFPPKVAEIESLRVNAASVDPQQAEDVIGQVVEINRLIASNQAWNEMPIICLTVPNGWDKIEPIPVPEEGITP